MYIHLEPLAGNSLGVPADMTRVQLNVRFAPVDDSERAFQGVYSTIVDALYGKQVDGPAAADAVSELNTLLAVIEGGSVTAAAEELVVTQPSVSSALAALARELDCELFVRSGRGIRLTEAGAAFAPYAADVIGLLNQGRQAVHEAAATVARRLQIIAATTAAESFVPPLMQAFSEQHPDIKLTLAVGNQREVNDVSHA